MNREKSYYRHHRVRAARRKFNILKAKWSLRDAECWCRGKGINVLSKRKIHCSCHSCSVKSSDYLKFRDERQISKMDAELAEYQKTATQ